MTACGMQLSVSSACELILRICPVTKWLTFGQYLRKLRRDNCKLNASIRVHLQKQKPWCVLAVQPEIFRSQTQKWGIKQ